MLISIVVLNYNGGADTQTCVDSLLKIEKNNNEVQIIVVDNNSKDSSLDLIGKYNNIKIIKNNKNLGFSGGMNVGIKKALYDKSDAVVLLNNDTRVDKKFLINLIKSYKNADILVPKIYFEKNSEFHKEKYSVQEKGKVIWYAGGRVDWKNIMGQHIGVDEVDIGKYDKEIDTEFATGACMLIKKTVIDKIGYLDEKYFLYLEDLDYSVRANKAGLKIHFVPSSLIWHKNAQSSGGSGSKLQDYFFNRNRIYFANKFTSARTKIALIKHLILKKKFRSLTAGLFLIIT